MELATGPFLFEEAVHVPSQPTPVPVNKPCYLCGVYRATQFVGGKTKNVPVCPACAPLTSAPFALSKM